MCVNLFFFFFSKEITDKFRSFIHDNNLSKTHCTVKKPWTSNRGDNFGFVNYYFLLLSLRGPYKNTLKKSF